MNKTLSIGLAGFSFMIEEHAYIKLGDYLSFLRSTLETNEVDEVMHDIEIRMVEIFRDYLGKREVINSEDVERVIQQIGKPEQIENQEESYYNKENTQKKKYNKQLFRDPSSQKIAGVCSGLAQYIGMDIRVMRSIWLGLALLGIFTAAISTSIILIVYIFLWIILPKAETASDFLKMKGQPVNFGTLKEESGKLVKFANESSHKIGQFYNQNRTKIATTRKNIWNALRYILGGIFTFMALSCFLGIFIILGILGIKNIQGIDTLAFIIEEDAAFLLKIIITLGCLIPTVLFGLLAIKLLSPKTKIKNLGYILALLFISLLALAIYFGITMRQHDMMFKSFKTENEEIVINTPKDSIYVDLKQIRIPKNYIGYDSDLFSDKKDVYLGNTPQVRVIRKDNVKTPYLIVTREAKGYNLPIELAVPIDIKDNKISLPNFVKFPYKDRFRDYDVDYELVIPLNTTVIPLSRKIKIIGDTHRNHNDSTEDTYDIDINSDDPKVSIENGKIIFNGKIITFNRKNQNLITIDGIEYSREEAEKILGRNMDYFKQELNESMRELEKDMKALEKDMKNLGKDLRELSNEF